jgi:hypothetical protein
MTNTAASAETLRSTTGLWSSADEAFFRIVGELFRPVFLQGASVLLSSYDPAPSVAEAPA